jgi:APA family basic amino acid/polyamine antiporter
MGINRTAAVAAGLAVATLCYFSAAAIAGIAHHLAPDGLVSLANGPSSLAGVLPAASIIFFAFAGYARVANLGNEVRDAKRNIPRAILLSLSLVLVLYLAVSLALVLNFGDRLGTLASPFISLFDVSISWMPAWVTQFVAAAATLGSMLALLAGVSRTAASMAEDQELPRAFERRNRFGSPWLAEAVIAVGSILVLQFGNLSWVIGFSSLSVLLYYAVGHFAALRQPASERKVPRVLTALGLVLCCSLLVAVPGPALWVSAIILLAALGVRAVARRRVNG